MYLRLDPGGRGGAGGGVSGGRAAADRAVGGMPKTGISLVDCSYPRIAVCLILHGRGKSQRDLRPRSEPLTCELPHCENY